MSCQNKQIFFHQNNVVRINWPVPSSDMSTIEHVKDFFSGQRVRRIILALRNLQARNAALQKELKLIPRYQIIRIILSMRNQWQSSFALDGGHTRYWRHSHLPNMTFKTNVLISCDIQRNNCISTFQTAYLFASEDGILCRHVFAKNDFDPQVTWHSVTTRVLALAK